MKRHEAVHFGIVFERATGNIVRIINPTYEFELDQHHVAEDEVMLRLRKREHQIPEVMSPADAYRLLQQYGGRA